MGDMEDQDLLSRKRKATTSDPEEDSEQHVSSKRPRGYERHLEYWLLDGNIVIVCDSTAFRVDRSVLSRKSKVLEERFRESIKPETAEYMDKCPVYHLDIKERDFERLLKTLLDGV